MPGFWTDFNRQIAAARDHSDTTDLHLRAGMRMGIRLDRDPREMSGTFGASSMFEGLFYLDSASKNRKETGGVFGVSLGSSDAAGWLPYLDTKLARDVRYGAVDVDGWEEQFPFCDPGKKIKSASNAAPMTTPKDGPYNAQPVGRPLPEGHPSILIAGSEEKSQHLALAGAWAGVLISDQRGDDGPKFSTALADISGSKIDPDHIGPISSALRVSGTVGGHCAAALEFGIPHKDAIDYGGGLFRSSGAMGGFGEFAALGLAGETGGGPIGTGAGAGDKHLVGTNQDGEPIVQGHINIGAQEGAPWFFDATRDAPPAFSGDWGPPTSGGVLTPTFLVYDKDRRHIGIEWDSVSKQYRRVVRQGVMDWQTRVPLLIVGPKDPPTPPEEGGDGVPPPLFPPPITPPKLPPKKDPQDGQGQIGDPAGVPGGPFGLGPLGSGGQGQFVDPPKPPKKKRPKGPFPRSPGGPNGQGGRFGGGKPKDGKDGQGKSPGPFPRGLEGNNGSGGRFGGDVLNPTSPNPTAGRPFTQPPPLEPGVYPTPTGEGGFSGHVVGWEDDPAAIPGPDDDDDCPVVSYSWIPLGIPELIGIPFAPFTDGGDAKRNDSPTRDEAMRATGDLPAVFAASFVGAASSSDESGFSLTERPRDGCRRGGTARGMLYIHPPELEIRDFFPAGERVTDLVSFERGKAAQGLSDSCIGMVPGKGSIGWGYPVFDGASAGCLGDGMEFGVTEAGGFSWWSLGSTGSRSEIVSFDSNGAPTFQGDELTMNGVGAINPPSGTTAQRPAVPADWATRSNSDTGALEAFDPAGAGTWRDFSFAGGAASPTSQMVSDSAVKTGTTIVPYDDTVPTRTEGDQYLTMLATIPAGTAKVYIKARINAAHSTLNSAIVAFIHKIAFGSQASASRTMSFSGNLLTASSGSFFADGFSNGMTLIVTGTTSNNGTYTISTVNTLSITITASSFTAEAGSTSARIDGETDALETVGIAGNSGSTNVPIQLLLDYEDVGVSVDTTITYAIRVGGSATGTTTVNGQSGARKFGGSATSTIRIVRGIE